MLLAARAGLPLAEEALYRVPWAEGLAFTIEVAPGQVLTPHIAASNRHAVDFAMREGTAVLAARSGVVVGSESRYGANADEEVLTYEGNYVLVRHDDGTLATYAHLKRDGVAVALGDRVEAGALLGYSGETGDTRLPGLHFGVSRREEGTGYEISVPVLFYVGAPPRAFSARSSLLVKADYSADPEMPSTASERRLQRWKRPEATPEELLKAWLTLAALAAALVLGIRWFWKFSRS